ncbi:MAG TPA: hypothetical protein GX707_07405 [Epulopiscium sp.]|nr:hypothetical protein [Candidatus Epulonipiscium sp.]
MDNDNTMSNMINLAKLFAPPTTSNRKSTPDGKSWPMFPIDAEIHTEPLRVCKSLIPYLPFEKQKSLSIFIKVYELMSVVNYFSAMDEDDHQAGNFRQSDTWQMDLLHSVKDNLDPANAYWVDILFKVNDVKNILASAQLGAPYKDPTTALATSNPTQPLFSQPSNEFIQNIAPMLDDNQRKLLETLSTIMK